ncbi:VOC family protein [Microbacterium thalassium]|uniref:Catechol 2,3-dioxygenase n=1 Tax=Microbacterium thalassium TaxID=362649 RepID=A0A7X0FPJ6_9MICO|nr:VOC family protein [Microbacterium thalassium]MBB6390835.1 catechol 2,3-dioxygenase [Microbacterium thalassium]GLK25943.1 glyoxalase [Microbacterium thalassium]
MLQIDVNSASAPARRRPIVVAAVTGAVAVLIAVITIVLVAATRAPAGADTAPASLLPAEAEMGSVELNVVDLPAMREYYADALGLPVMEEDAEHVVLGFDEPLVTLLAGAAGADDPSQAGLYHTAILFPDEPALAAALLTVADRAPESYQGAADHAVSLAFYFGDPEGNGVELYVDRPRDEWVWQDGEVTMGSAFLDPNAFIAENADGVAPSSATVGHVHLRVGDLDRARAFYSDALGFAVTSQADGALFYSAGGYHHHLATNVWLSDGAGERGAGPGLGAFVVRVPNQADVDDVAARLAGAGIEYESAPGVLVTSDPWGNVVRVLVG